MTELKGYKGYYGDGIAVGSGDENFCGNGGGVFSGDNFMNGHGDVNLARDEFCGERWSRRPFYWGLGRGESSGEGSANQTGFDHLG